MVQSMNPFGEPKIQVFVVCNETFCLIKNDSNDIILNISGLAVHDSSMCIILNK